MVERREKSRFALESSEPLMMRGEKLGMSLID